MADDQAIELETEDRDWWTMHRGDSPILGTALHNGHLVRKSLEDKMALDEEDRLREEDPFTEFIFATFLTALSSTDLVSPSI